MTHPLPSAEIAVVIVTLNALDALKRTVDSVLHSGDDRFKVYIVDGASRDGTADYLGSLPPGRATWISERDRGIYDAMNKGWNMVPADAYVLYLGAGDRVVSPPARQLTSVDAARAGRIVIGVCDIGVDPFRSEWTANLRFGNTAHHQAMLVPRANWGVSPFDESLRVYGDWDFNVRMFKSGITATFDDGFRSYAEPGGVSAVIHLGEAVRVAYRHGGLRVALRAYVRNRRSRNAYLRRLETVSDGPG